MAVRAGDACIIYIYIHTHTFLCNDSNVRALKINDKDLYVLISYGKLKISQGKTEEAIKYFNSVYKIDKSFLDQLGINTNSIDPRKIRIFGHGGEMLSMKNTENFMLDPIENAIKVNGEDDGIFDNNDNIIFFAKGPDNYNSESDTHLNLYEEKT